MDVQTLVKNLAAFEKKVHTAPRKGTRYNMIYLKLFDDGSGSVVADCSPHEEGMTRDQQLLAQIFSEEDDIFSFGNIDELDTWFKEQLADA